MQKEEKQLESSLDVLIQNVKDLKNTISSFLQKLEHEYDHLSWPNVLDNFALLSGQLNSLGKQLKGDKITTLRNYVLFPVLLSPERDLELEKLTEERVLAFNHEVVPDYLRTKPDAEVEEKINNLSAKASSVVPENATKQLNTLNKITSNILDILNSARDEWEKETVQKTAQPQTSIQSDTHTLIAATLVGKGLRMRPNPPTTPTPPMTGQSSNQQQKVQQKSQGSLGKAPSAIKTNIKAATTSHPYQRS
ncbi:mediator of RNA polymerase II transcription subunit 8-like [Haliotis asinina]|uniref:mediator of RNA polymerase II transcription subunit 8-like n=1 Tax=Haliotis asinina TaxID=109174 RepID=UPI00353189E2